MIGKLAQFDVFGRAKSGRGPPRAPDGDRIYAIGDIHGRADLLDRMLDAIETDRGDQSATLVFLGDYIDRGPDSARVIDRLLQSQMSRKGSRPVFLLGNHEASLLDFLERPAENDAWLDWGGYETILSYGVDPSAFDAAAPLAAALARAMPEAHRKFYATLALHHAAGDYFFVHAGVRPGTPLDGQARSDLLWIRERFHRAKRHERPDKVVVHGHHPVDAPEDHGWRIAVDTGAVWSGQLSAVVLEGDQRRFLTVSV